MSLELDFVCIYVDVCKTHASKIFECCGNAELAVYTPFVIFAMLEFANEG